LYIAYQDPVILIPANPVFVHQCSDSIICGYAGGCEYEIEADGLATSLEPGVFYENNNRLEVCGRICEPDLEKSDFYTVFCTIPDLPTSYSIENYGTSIIENVVTAAYSLTSSNPSELYKLTDGDLSEDYEDSSVPCYIQFEYQDMFYASLDEVSFYINDMTSNTPYIDGLKFQGSNDGSTWVDLWVIDANVKQGWNTWFCGGDQCEEVPGQYTKPAYSKYRFYGSKSGACRITEIDVEGVIAVDETDASITCPMMIYVDEDAVEGEDVYYRNSVTTELTSIVPRHGTVKGGDLVTFYAYPLSPFADIWVTIDGVDCAVQDKDWEYVTCITGEKTDPYAEKSLKIYVQNKGLVSVYGQFFNYVQLWSDP
jgi:hypothetical protein